jgi:tetratricopeptide (TPR) repeat protein
MLRPAVVSDRSSRWTVGFLVCLTCLTSGCAVRNVRHDGGSSGSLASYVARVRALSQQARPQPPAGAQTVESWDPKLSNALVALAIAPTPTAAQHRQVAFEYRRLGILDRAYAHFASAVKLDPTDAASFDGLARVWRDWGFPELGMDDAHRAVSLAPKSAEAANTLGTLLHAQGRTREAVAWYERASRLDAGAYYAFNNLCYASIIAKRDTAVGSCERAAALAPQLKAAQNNLALAYAAAGRFDLARQQLERASDAAAVEYNAGILYLADRQFAKAAEAFDSAVRMKPHFDLAEARARQARSAAAGAE